MCSWTGNCRIQLIVLSVYRDLTGDFNQFLTKLDDTLKYLYKPKTEFLLCGDINTDYLHESNQKKYLSPLLTTYNLRVSHTVDFATRIQNKSSTAIDNIFVDNSRLESTIISSLINGFLTTMPSYSPVILYMQQQKVFLQQRTRIINRETLTSFQSLLKQEICNLFIKPRMMMMMMMMMMMICLINFWIPSYMFLKPVSQLTIEVSKRKKKMLWSHKELRYHANKREIYIPSLKTAMIQRQKHIT